MTDQKAHTTFAEQFFNRDLRVEVLIHLATVGGGPGFPTHVQDAVEDDLPEIMAAMAFKVCDEDDELSPEEFLEYCQDYRKLGFLVRFATPVPRFLEGGGYQASWGHYTMTWCYAETLEGAYKAGLLWVATYHDKKKKEAGL